eukprot:6153364-Amphidinium_carterae.1
MLAYCTPSYASFCQPGCKTAFVQHMRTYWAGCSLQYRNHQAPMWPYQCCAVPGTLQGAMRQVLRGHRNERDWQPLHLHVVPPCRGLGTTSQ